MKAWTVPKRAKITQPLPLRSPMKARTGPNYSPYAVGARCRNTAGTLQGNSGTFLGPFLWHPSAGTMRAHSTNASALWAHCGHTAGKQRARCGHTASTQRAGTQATPVAPLWPRHGPKQILGTIAGLSRHRRGTIARLGCCCLAAVARAAAATKLLLLPGCC